MLENSKSTYFIKRLFSFVDENKKLEIIKYNKNLQNIIDISLINYKFLSGRYIIFEKDGMMKEYDKLEDKLLFEGECLNKKRNGKGKEYYWNGELKFVGEYLNGKRNGKGKEYRLNSFFEVRLKFEGEYLDGKRWNGNGYGTHNDIIYTLKDGKGMVKDYNDFDGSLIYEQEYVDGKRNGKGKEYNGNGTLSFEGEYLYGKRNGKGKEYSYSGQLRFEGEYSYGKRWNGKGYDLDNNIVYSLKDGKGIVKEYNDNGSVLFEVEYLNGEINGKGKKYLYGDLIFEGEYLDGERNGNGKEYQYGKLIFEGEYLYNQKRKGKFYINNNLEYEGEYLNERKFNGKGYDEKGNVIYELINGTGKVKEYDDYNGGLKYDGE